MLLLIVKNQTALVTMWKDIKIPCNPTPPRETLWWWISSMYFLDMDIVLENRVTESRLFPDYFKLIL